MRVILHLILTRIISVIRNLSQGEAMKELIQSMFVSRAVIKGYILLWLSMLDGSLMLQVNLSVV